MRVWSKVFVLVGVVVMANSALGQENSSMNTYTPYSLYGLGDVQQQGLTAARGMAGLATGVRDSRQINYVNPAAANARDSLTFVFDFGGEMKNFYLQSATTKSSNNSINFHHLAVAFPLGGTKFGMNFGLTPYSYVGYEIEHRELNDTIIHLAGDVRSYYRGEDGLNQIFFNVAYNLLPQLSLGLGVKYYFGSLARYRNEMFNSSAAYYNTYTSSTVYMGDIAFLAGVQYEQKLLSGKTLTAGLALQPASNIASRNTSLSTTVSKTAVSEGYLLADTAFFAENKNPFKMPMQLNVGASLTKPDKWLLGVEFNYQDWSKTAIDGRENEMGQSYDIRLGGHYIPNRYDVRYFYKRITYRAGLRYSQSPMVYNGRSVNDKAASVGLGVPMRGMGDLNFGLEVGQRGTTSYGMVRENYVTIMLSLTLFEAWFVKYKYE
jgi:hypothetical protein